MNTAVALILLLLGSIIIATLSRALFIPIIKSINISNYFFQKKITAAESAFQNGCKAFSNGDIEDGFSFVEQSFLFGSSNRDLMHLDKIARYNFSVIDRLAEIISEEDSRSDDLALLEGLFQSRTEILKSLTEEPSSTSSHQRKELLDRCQTNEKTIRTHLKTISLSLTKKASPHVSYH